MFFRLINRTEGSFLFSFHAFFVVLPLPASELRRRRRPLPHPWPLHQPERTRTSRQPSASSSVPVNLLSFPPRIWPRVSQFFSVHRLPLAHTIDLWMNPQIFILCNDSCLTFAFTYASQSIDLYERFAHWFGTAPLNL